MAEETPWLGYLTIDNMTEASHTVWDLVEADFRIPPRRTANSCITNFAFWLRPDSEERLNIVASGKELMTLRKDLMTVWERPHNGIPSGAPESP